MGRQRLSGLAGILAIACAATAPAAILRPITLDNFSDRSIIESFEGLSPGENIEAVPLSEVYTDNGTRRSGLDGDGFLRPGVNEPFVLPSGIEMTAFWRHSSERTHDALIGDFALGDARFFGVRSHIVESVDHVPDGTAYLASHGDDLRFELPWDTYRFGMMMRPLGLRLFDEQGNLLYEDRFWYDIPESPLKAFESDQPFRTVELYYPGGPRVDGAARYILDHLIADPLPEPASLTLLLAPLGLIGRTLSRRASGGIITPCPHPTRTKHPQTRST